MEYTTLQGRYYDGQTAVCQEIQLWLDANDILHAEPTLFEPLAIGDVQISSRIGNTPRTITLPSGAIVETDDHAVLDSWAARHSKNANLIHRLESRLSYALGALICVFILLITGAIWGVPWISNIVAHAVPTEAVAKLGSETLNYLDKSLLEPSELDADRRQTLTRRFNTLLPADTESLNYNLAFRDGGFIGANAFALPDGTIVVTDELVELAGDDNEIAAVLLHEIGHVVHRHGLRQVISHAGLSALTIAFTGDVTAAGAVVIALPSILMESSYSRDHEWEADGYALKKMQELGIPLNSFADFMERLEAGHTSEFEAADSDLACEPQDPVTAEELGLEEDTIAEEGRKVASSESEQTKAEEDESEPESAGWFSYISSHPPSEERIARFREAAQGNENTPLMNH